LATIPVANSSLGFFNTKEYQDINGMLSGAGKKAIGTAIPYVSYSGGKWLMNPTTVSVQTFQKMSRSDNIIGACLEYHAASITATIGDYYHEKPEIQQHVRKAVKKLKGGLNHLIKKMMTAYWAGFSTIEKIEDYDDELGSHYISDTLLLPPTTIIFSADNDGRLEKKGIHQYVINAAIPSYANTFSYGIMSNGDTSGIDPMAANGDFAMPIRTIAFNPIGLVDLPLEHVIHFSNSGLADFENPYGYSMLRRVYNLYLLKYGILQALAVAYDRRATPLLAVYTSAEQALNVMDEFGKSRLVGAIEAAQSALKDLNSSSAFILPGMKGKVYDLEALNIDSDFSGFIEGIRLIDTKIMQGLKIPESIFTAEGGSSYALGSAQGSVYQTFSDSMREDIMHVLMQHYIRHTIELAFTPEEHETDWGHFGAKLSNIDDKLKYSELFKSLREIQCFGGENLGDANFARETTGMSEVDNKGLKEIQKGINTQENPTSPAGAEGGHAPGQKRKIADMAGDTYGHNDKV
jgi:hypothetical protein